MRGRLVVCVGIGAIALAAGCGGSSKDCISSLSGDPIACSDVLAVSKSSYLRKQQHERARLRKERRQAAKQFARHPTPKPQAIAPKPKPAPKPAPAPKPDPRQAALTKTINCLRSYPFLTVKRVTTVADIEVYASVSQGGGNAEIAVLHTHQAAERYANSGGPGGLVGTLAAAIYAYKDSPDFQAAVQGCLA
jgi:hypothetical protein